MRDLREFRAKPCTHEASRGSLTEVMGDSATMGLIQLQSLNGKMRCNARHEP